ncbi:MAG: hypothetical protein ABIK53_09065 [bacterium]
MRKVALLSTNSPEKIISHCRKLYNLGWKLLGTRETVMVMKQEGIPIEDVSEFTNVGYEYGIPPTLHPKIEQALTTNTIERIDLVYDVPYPLNLGNDVGGRTLLGLGIKGDRIVIMNEKDFKRIIDLLESKKRLPDEVRSELSAKAAFEIASHYLALSQGYSNRHECILGSYTTTCREGENPYQVPCELFAIDSHDKFALFRFTQISGEPLCFTNTADMDNVVTTLVKLKAAFTLNFKKTPYIAVAAKHGNPCGLAVDWNHKDEVITKALWGNPQAVWGGEFICNFTIDKELSQLLLKSEKRQQGYGHSKWMLDVIIAPSFSPEAISILGKRKRTKLLINPALSSSDLLLDKWSYRFVRGGFLRQPASSYILSFDSLISKTYDLFGLESILIAWVVAYTSFYGGNEIALAKDFRLIGVGGGPSTVMAAQHAVEWSKTYSRDIKNASFAADAFFPFVDAPEVLVKAGCKSGVVPSGGENHRLVFEYFKNQSVAVGFIPEQYRGFCRH